MATPLFTPEEARGLEGRAFERIWLEVLIRKSDMCNLHQIKLRGRLDSIEASAQLGVALPGCVFDLITKVDYNGGEVRFKTIRFPNTFASLANIAGRQKAQNSTEAMYFLQVYHAFNTKILQGEREAGTIHPSTVMGPISLLLWHVIGGSRFTIDQFSVGRSMENFVRMHSMRCGFLANTPEHRDFVPQCLCPDGPRGEAAAGGFNEVVMQAVVRGLAPEIWAAIAQQRRRGAIVNTFLNLSVQEYMTLYESPVVRTALTGLEREMVPAPPYPGHPGLQPGEVEDVSPEISSRHVDRDHLLASLQSLLVRQDQ